MRFSGVQVDGLIYLDKCFYVIFCCISVTKEPAQLRSLMSEL